MFVEACFVVPIFRRKGDFMEPLIVFDEVVKTYRMGETVVNAVDGISFEIAKGEFVIIVGPSGAGKSTVLNILGGMDGCSSGRVTVDGARVDEMDWGELIEYRRFDIGFVFQFYNLMQNLTALENVELATQIADDPMNPAEALMAVGLAHRMDNFPSQLSGGEQQRVSIARALAKNPKLLLCDEPTGALDYVTGKEILSLMQRTCRETGMATIVVTHNGALAPMADRIIQIKNGRVSKAWLNENVVPVEEIEW